jgi:hypothetical protein
LTKVEVDGGVGTNKDVDIDLIVDDDLTAADRVLEETNRCDRIAVEGQY